MVHIHEPVAPLISWVATDWTRLPLVGTFHSYSGESRVQRAREPDRGAADAGHLHVRIAVSGGSLGPAGASSAAITG